MKLQQPAPSYRHHPFAYLSLDEVAERFGLTREQVLRLGMSGDLIFSVLENEPSNYEEVTEHPDENGGLTVRTRRKITRVIIAAEESPLKLRYIHPEDVIQTVINAAPGRKTLVHRLYLTRELLPEKGRLRINNPIKVDIKDLLIQRDELERFEKNHLASLRKLLPLQVPEKITLAWLYQALPWNYWVSAASLLMGVFFIGVQFAQTKLYVDLTSPASTHAVGAK